MDLGVVGRPDVLELQKLVFLYEVDAASDFDEDKFERVLFDKVEGIDDVVPSLWDGYVTITIRAKSYTLVSDAQKAIEQAIEGYKDIMKMKG